MCYSQMWVFLKVVQLLKNEYPLSRLVIMPEKNQP